MAARRRGEDCPRRRIDGIGEGTTCLKHESTYTKRETFLFLNKENVIGQPKASMTYGVVFRGYLSLAYLSAPKSRYMDWRKVNWRIILGWFFKDFIPVISVSLKTHTLRRYPLQESSCFSFFFSRSSTVRSIMYTKDQLTQYSFQPIEKGVKVKLSIGSSWGNTGRWPPRRCQLVLIHIQILRDTHR